MACDIIVLQRKRSYQFHPRWGATSVHAIDAERLRFCCAFLGTRRRRLSRVIDTVGPNEQVSRNFPCFTQLVDHVDRERVPPKENFGRTRATQ